MPYIKQDARDELLVQENRYPENPGELNYVFSVLCWNYFCTEGKGNYQAINDIIGALEGAKMEFYRRVASPYEDSKMIQNGDVFINE